MSHEVASTRKDGILLTLSIALLLAALAAPQAQDASPAFHYRRGMDLWRSGQAAEALRYLMSAARDPEVSLYAARQVASMGSYALPVLYQGLWHREPTIQRQSAIILGWIGDRASVDPLLLRLKQPDAPVEIEYALRKIGSLTGPQLLGLFEEGDLSRAALLDRKAGDLARLASALALPVDPVPLVKLVESMDERGADELAQDPFGHLAAARLKLLRFLAERGVARAAPLLMSSFRPGAGEANLLAAEALVHLGPASVPLLAKAFSEQSDPSLRGVLAVAHYLASGGGEIASSSPASTYLNEAAADARKAAQAASIAARLATSPNAFVSWFLNHPDPAVRKALAPASLPEETSRARPAMKRLFLEKSRDRDPEVAVAHLEMAARYVPDPEVEARITEILGSADEEPELRESALAAALENGLVAPVLRILASPSDPLRPRAIDFCAARPGPEIVSAVLRVLEESEPTVAKRHASEVAAVVWKRPEAAASLWRMLRAADALWLSAARGLGALGDQDAVDPFLQLVQSGRPFDPQTAEITYFALGGGPVRLAGKGSGSYRFVPRPLETRPPAGRVLVLLRERNDFRGWVKVEERWETPRRFRLDQGTGELTLYDPVLFERIQKGAAVVILEDTVRQTILNPLELSEVRSQHVEIADTLPAFPFAGLEGDGLKLAHQGRWVTVALGSDLRDTGEASRISAWGRAALVVFRPFPREAIRVSSVAPPAGWLRDAPQPVEAR